MGLFGKKLQGYIEAGRRVLLMQTDALSSSYQGLQEREQKFLVAAGVLLSLAVVALGILLPMQERRAELSAASETLFEQAKEAERLASLLKQRPPDERDSTAGQANLLSQVDRLARKRQVRSFMVSIQPRLPAGGGGQSLLVKFRNVPYSDALPFIHELALEHLGVADLKIQAGSTDGLVHMQMVVSH